MRSESVIQLKRQLRTISRKTHLSRKPHRTVPPYGSPGCNCTQYLAGNWDSSKCPIHGAKVVEGRRQ